MIPWRLISVLCTCLVTTLSSGYAFGETTNSAERGSFKSRDYRAESRFTVLALAPTFGFIQSSDYGVFDYGFELGYMFSDALRITVSVKQGVPWRYGMGSMADISSGGTVEAYGAGVQWFLGNSLYIRGGLESRHFNSEISKEKYVSGTSASEDSYHYVMRGRLRTLTLGPTFGLGNQWHLGKFVLGADWTAVYRAAITLKESRSVLTSDDENYVDAEQNEIRNGLIYYIPRLIIGMSL